MKSRVTKLLAKLKVLEPWYSPIAYIYDFPETFLKNKYLEKLRRKIIMRLMLSTLINQFGIDTLNFYLDVRKHKLLYKRIRDFQLTVPKEEFGAFHQPEILYVILRAVKPEIVVETGVSYGVSSAFILQALEDNDRGVLFSVDLPFQFAPKDYTGIVVPDYLRKRWKLLLGDSKVLLPSLLKELEIDIFLHDSLHTYEHMMFEFKSVWPHLKVCGYLLSDNINLNDSFYDFARQKGAEPVILYSSFGFLRKVHA